MSLAVLEFLEELRLRLIIEVGVFEMLLVSEPDRRVENL